MILEREKDHVMLIETSFIFGISPKTRRILPKLRLRKIKRKYRKRKMRLLKNKNN